MLGFTGLSSSKNIDTTKGKIHRIACLTPSSALGIMEAIDGFKDSLVDYGIGEIKLDIFDSNGSRTLLRSHIEEIIEREYDLIFSLGTECTKSLREVCAKRKVEPPVVFCGVKNPAEQDIVESEQRSGNNFTGVSADHNLRLQLALLRIVKKDLKNVLVVYDPTQLGGFTAQQKREVEEIFAEQNVQVRSVEIFNVNEVNAKVSAVIAGADLVLTLRDHTASSAMEALSKICLKHNVTLFASDLNSLDHGAALAFGVRDVDNGILAAKKAREILHEGKKPTDIPIISLDERYKLRLNAELMENQNLKIDDNLLFLMEHGDVI